MPFFQRWSDVLRGDELMENRDDDYALYFCDQVHRFQVSVQFAVAF